MRLGFIGLGKMGYEMACRLKREGFEPVCFDLAAENCVKSRESGLTVVDSVAAVATALPGGPAQRRVILLMVPAGEAVDACLGELTPQLAQGDVIVDCGNSNFNDSLCRGQALQELGIGYLDCGTSGGLEGARNGACLMVGGDATLVATCEPVFQALAQDGGYQHVGAAGSGHFLKMVHNGMEYGMMQALAEGYELLEKSRFDYDYAAVSRLFQNGSIIQSYLMETLVRAFAKDDRLEAIKGVMQSSGEGRWTVETALDLNACTPVIAMSQFMRYRSLEEDTFAGKVVAAMRNEFGGHAVTKK